MSLTQKPETKEGTFYWCIRGQRAKMRNRPLNDVSECQKRLSKRSERESKRKINDLDNEEDRSFFYFSEALLETKLRTHITDKNNRHRIALFSGHLLASKYLNTVK